MTETMYGQKFFEENFEFQLRTQLPKNDRSRGAYCNQPSESNQDALSSLLGDPEKCPC